MYLLIYAAGVTPRMLRIIISSHICGVFIVKGITYSGVFDEIR